jgi:hypothetical protein
MTSGLPLFLKILCEVEEQEGGAPLRVTVQYTGLSEPAEGAVPWGAEKLTTTGILDPGFGDGPVEYADVESVSVWCEFHGGRNSPIAQAKFDKLSAAFEGFQSVRLNKNTLTWTLR